MKKVHTLDLRRMQSDIKTSCQRNLFLVVTLGTCLFVAAITTCAATNGELTRTELTDVKDERSEGLQKKQQKYDHPEKVTADFEDFPNLHPLFVHFPVVLFPMAFIIQLLGLFRAKREMSWVVLILLSVGYGAAIIAVTYVHPHVDQLPDHAKKVFEKHDTYATWTLWLGGTALVFKAVSQFLMKLKGWAEIAVAVVLLGSAYTVSVAGHHGSQLVFIEGIGPKGEFLETEGHSHSDDHSH